MERIVRLLIAIAGGCAFSCSASMAPSEDQGGSTPGSGRAPPGGPASTVDGSPPPPSQPELMCLAPNAAHSLRLLTRFEYDNTVRDLLGETRRLASAFPPENRVLGLENNSDSHVVNPLLIQKYEDAAEDIASHAVSERFSAIVPCDPARTDPAECGGRFLDRFLERAFRRPVEMLERMSFGALFEGARIDYDFNTAVAIVIQAVLQSPQFLYRAEADDDGPAPGGVVLATPYEIASRLSYFLWSSMPDDQLLAEAEAGRLSTPHEIESQARRLLADPRARDAVAHFHQQWLKFEDLATIVKDHATFPEYSDAMRPSWLESMRAFVRHAYFDGDGTLEQLFLEPTVYLDATLAPLYGVAPSGQGMQPYRLDPSDRAGLLTQPALMALLAAPNQGSPVKRGVFVRKQILCEDLPPPPPNIMVTAPNPDPHSTERERFAEHEANPACAGCHIRIDPIGFGFEKLDALGRFRATDNGMPVDASGSLRFTADPSIEGDFDGAVELSQKLARSTEVRDCFVRQWFRYAAGRIETDGDQCSLAEVRQAFDASGGKLGEMLVALTLTDAFRYRRVGAN
jgi:uncharacterized protein DUF1592/uncharacterized protein DUF1588/uncharacterized protein DUF1587/uncharacterized protein DUF1585/uncharacterized protein DUF1595